YRGDRSHSSYDAGCAVDFATATPRYLQYRGLGPVDLRLEADQPDCGGLGEAGGRGWRGHGCSWCGEGWCRCDPDQWSLRWYGCLAAVVDQECWRELGAWLGRDAADAGAERLARSRAPAGRWWLEDGPRCGDGGVAGCRRVLVRYGGAGGAGLCDGPHLSLEQLPGRYCHATP